MRVDYVDEYRDRFGVEPICAVLPIAPLTNYTHGSAVQHAAGTVNEVIPESCVQDFAETVSVPKLGDEQFDVVYTAMGVLSGCPTLRGGRRSWRTI